MTRSERRRDLEYRIAELEHTVKVYRQRRDYYFAEAVRHAKREAKLEAENKRLRGIVMRHVRPQSKAMRLAANLSGQEASDE